MKSILISLLIGVGVSAKGQDIFIGIADSLYMRLEEAPNHKRDKEKTIAINPTRIYFNEAAGKIYFSGIDTISFTSYLTKVVYNPYQYVFYGYKYSSVEVHVLNSEVQVVPGRDDNRFPKLYQIYLLNQSR